MINKTSDELQEQITAKNRMLEKMASRFMNDGQGISTVSAGRQNAGNRNADENHKTDSSL